MTASASIPGGQPAQRATGPEHNAFSSLSEDEVLALLKSLVLTTEDVDRLSKHAALIKSRKVKFAIAIHPCTPRHVSLPLVRHLFTFDLMRVALTPAVPADVKVAAEESLINRLETLSEGEKLSLAKRASGRVASALLVEREPRVRRAALENPRLTESAVIKAVTRYGATAGLIQTVCHHPKWSVRGEVRIALLRA